MAAVRWVVRGGVFCVCSEVLWLARWCEAERSGSKVVSAMDSELWVQVEDFEGGTPCYRSGWDRFFQVIARHSAALRLKRNPTEEGQIVVRSGKGDQDRITGLPERAREPLGEQIERVRRQHQRRANDDDLCARDEQAGLGGQASGGFAGL